MAKKYFIRSLSNLKLLLNFNQSKIKQSNNQINIISRLEKAHSKEESKNENDYDYVINNLNNLKFEFA